jgi:hypothetical protein
MVEESGVVAAGKLGKEPSPGRRPICREIGYLVERVCGVEEVKAVFPTLQIGLDRTFR